MRGGGAIEVAFHDSKQSLGFEEPQSWTRRAVERTAPVAMLLYSLIVLWFVREGHHNYRPLTRPVVHHQSSALVRRHAGHRAAMQPPRTGFCHWGLGGQGSRKVLELLENTAALAT